MGAAELLARPMSSRRRALFDDAFVHEYDPSRGATSCREQSASLWRFSAFDGAISRSSTFADPTLDPDGISAVRQIASGLHASASAAGRYPRVAVGHRTGPVRG